MTTTFDTDDPRNIWVWADAPGDGLGTHDSPFAEISDAIKKAAPGQQIVLMPGTYPGDLTVDASGEEKAPIYISAQNPGEAIVENGCWYFYDASDLIVSGITFKNARHGAISVMGKCLRNRFHNISFIDCGTDDKASCTIYFGGAGGRFNIVENCVFTREARTGRSENGGVNKQNTAVGLMVSDGTDEAPLLNHIVKSNKFSGYDRAIIIGSGSGQLFESGHIADLNKITACAADGIVIKCSDVRARGNEVKNCAGTGIILDGGDGSEIEGNLISGCGAGITISGTGHSVNGNHIT